jgi:probable addiction module antidote protein
MSDYKDDLLEDLRSPGYAGKYLSAAHADSAEAFLVALRDVVTAQKGMTVLAKAAEVNRENLYRMLSKDGNPRLKTLRAVSGALRMRTIFVPEETSDVEPSEKLKQPGLGANHTMQVETSRFGAQPMAPAINTSLIAGWTTGAMGASAIHQWNQGTNTGNYRATIQATGLSGNSLEVSSKALLSQVANAQTTGGVHNPLNP